MTAEEWVKAWLDAASICAYFTAQDEHEITESLSKVLTEHADEAVADALSHGMPPTTVSEERLAEIRGWLKATDERKKAYANPRLALVHPNGWLFGHDDTNTDVSQALRDQAAHIDVLEARLRDMSQDDVGLAFKAGHKEGGEHMLRKLIESGALSWDYIGVDDAPPECPECGMFKPRHADRCILKEFLK